MYQMGEMKKAIRDKLMEMRKVIEIDVKTKEKIENPEGLDKAVYFLFEYVVDHYPYDFELEDAYDEEPFLEMLEEFFWWEGNSIEDRKLVGEFIYGDELRTFQPALYEKRLRFTRKSKLEKLEILDQIWDMILDLQATGMDLSEAQEGIEKAIWKYGRDTEFGRGLIHDLNEFKRITDLSEE